MFCTCDVWLYIPILKDNSYELNLTRFIKGKIWVRFLNICPHIWSPSVGSYTEEEFVETYTVFLFILFFSVPLLTHPWYSIHNRCRFQHENSGSGYTENDKWFLKNTKLIVVFVEVLLTSEIPNLDWETSNS